MLPAILFVRGGLSYAHNEKKTKLLPSWDARLLICCEASVCWDGARERTDVHRRIPSLPHICYTRRHLHPKLLVESAENKFGSVHFFKKSWKVFCEYWKKKYISWYTSGFLLLCASICRAIWACHVAVNHIEQQSLRGVEKMGVLEHQEHLQARIFLNFII